MSKFVVQCPNCGKYAERKTGFFHSNRIICSCGTPIDLKMEKMTSRTCPHCGNNVVYDRTKAENAVCPVCHNRINDSDDGMVKFNCAQCGVSLSAAKHATKYVCPVCDFENNVVEMAAKKEAMKHVLISVLKYEGNNDTFVWKHPVDDFKTGTQLIVHEAQEALFLRDGKIINTFAPGRYTLETQNLPFLTRLMKIGTGGEDIFHCEVYFVNKATHMGIKWGTPEKVRFIDPLTGVPLELGASGEMNLQVADSKKLLTKLVGTMKGIAWDDGAGFSKSLQASFRPLIANAVKTNLSAVIKNNAIDLLEIDEKLDIISENLKEKIGAGFEEYGITIPQLYVNNVVLPEDDPNFKRIRELHTITLQTRTIQAEATVKTAQAQAQAQYRTAEEQSRAAIEAAHREAEIQKQLTETEIARHEAERQVIAAQARAQAQRMAGLTEAEIMQAKGYNQKDVLQAEVQKSYAEAIGNMGPAISAGGGGSSMINDMMGLGVGIAAAKAIAPEIGSMLQGFGGVTAQAQPTATASQSVGWTCPNCNTTGITGKFCPECGAKRPETKPVGDFWTCPDCGATGITSKFCPECGHKRPEPATWTCPDCGTTGITTKFCPECGRKRD